MAVDFPQNPFIGMTVIIGDVTYTWDGLVWRMSGGTGGGHEEDQFVRKTGDTMTGLLVLSGDPALPLGAATKQYADYVASIPPPTASQAEMVAGTVNDKFATPFATMGLTGLSVTALLTNSKTLVPAINELKSYLDFVAAGGIFVGAMNASNGTMRWTQASGQTLNELPMAAPANKGWYVIADVSGNVPPPGAPPGHYDVGDWVISDGTAWHRLAFGGAIIEVVASAVAVVPPVEGQTNVQTALQALSNNKVAGPPMAVADRIALFDGTTGKLIKDSGQTIAAIQAAMQIYADTQDALRVLKAGDTMTGPLNVPLTPSNDAHAASKKYVDEAVAAGGGGSGGGTVLVTGPELSGNGSSVAPITFNGISRDGNTFSGNGLFMTPLAIHTIDGGIF